MKLEVLTDNGLKIKTFTTWKVAQREIKFIDFRRHEISRAWPVQLSDGRWAIETSN